MIQPIDLRLGFDRLSGLVSEHLGRSERSGALFVFRGKRREGHEDSVLRRQRTMFVL